MADIRINALATTAASTASDDFIAVDGSANGTRKLNAFSPTFGGNLTVSGTIYPSGASSTLTASAANTIVGSNGATRLQIDHGNGGWGRLQLIPQQTRADISAVLNNATTAQTLGLVGSSVEILTSGGTLAATFNSSQNTILAGNLTVSGTAINLSTNNSTDKVVSIGYSTVPLYLTSSYDGSTFGLSGFSANSRPSGSSYTTPSNTSYGNLYFLAKIAASDTASAFEWKHAPRTAGTPVTTSLMTLNGSGNLLIGTTTDGGQKLQVDGTAYVSGDATFAGNVTRTRSAAGSTGSAVTDYLVRLGNSTSPSAAGVLASNIGASNFRTSLVLRTTDTSGNAVDAATFDYAGDATFAKNLTVGSGTASQNILLNGTVDNYIRWANAGNARWQLITTTSETGSNAGSDLSISRFSDAGSFLGTAFTLTRSTGDATFAGAIAIGNTVNTVSPTSPNRTITMVIGGTTYYIHAKTTND